MRGSGGSGAHPARPVPSQFGRSPPPAIWSLRPCRGRQGGRPGGVAVVVGEFTGAAVAADQQLVAAQGCPGQIDDDPVVEALSLRAAPGRELLPGPLRHLPRQYVGAELSCAGGHFGRTGHREDMADAAFPQSRTESWITAVDLVPGDPADAVSGVKEPFDHRAGQVRLGREDGVLAESGCPATVRVARPGARDVWLQVHRCVPALATVAFAPTLGEARRGDARRADQGVRDPGRPPAVDLTRAATTAHTPRSAASASRPWPP